MDEAGRILVGFGDQSGKAFDHRDGGITGLGRRLRQFADVEQISLAPALNCAHRFRRDNSGLCFGAGERRLEVRIP